MYNIGVFMHLGSKLVHVHTDNKILFVLCPLGLSLSHQTDLVDSNNEILPLMMLMKPIT